MELVLGFDSLTDGFQGVATQAQLLPGDIRDLRIR
jgi:hypothetical protein